VRPLALTTLLFSQGATHCLSEVDLSKKFPAPSQEDSFSFPEPKGLCVYPQQPPATPSDQRLHFLWWHTCATKETQLLPSASHSWHTWEAVLLEQLAVTANTTSGGRA
jgi:hypothetical protein